MNNNTFYDTDNIIQSLIHHVAHHAWEKQVMKKRNLYIAKGALMFTPELFTRMHEKKYDDKYII